MGIVVALIAVQMLLRRDCFWFPEWLLLSLAGLSHARSIVKAWRQEYNEERAKKGLGGLTSPEHARRLATKPDALTAGSGAMK